MVSFSRIATFLFIIVTLVQRATILPILFPVLTSLIYLGVISCMSTRTSLPGKRDLAAGCPIDPRFSGCISDLKDGGKVTAHVNEDKTMVVGGLFPACIGQVIESNSSPDIKSLNDKYGTITALNETSLQLSGMSEDTLLKIASLVTIVK
jgi:hypothetical protein